MKRRFANAFALTPVGDAFATTKVDRWVQIGLVQEMSFADARNGPVVSAAFVVHGSEDRGVIDYGHVKGHFRDMPFCMEGLLDLAPQLRPNDSLFKDDLCDVYYYLGIRAADRHALTFRVGRRFFISSPSTHLWTKGRALYLYEASPTV